MSNIDQPTPTPPPADAPNPRNENEYGSSQIQVLEGLEAVRKRPGMYIGDVHDGSGLHHCVWEVVDNAVDEHLAGHCHHIEVRVLADGSLSVSDDGRGIPVGMHAKGVSAAEVVMTVLHAGGKFDNESYRVSAGLHGVGVSAVNAVSETLKLEIKREGKVWYQEYRQGRPVASIAPIGETQRTGTKVTFKPDRAIFSSVEFNFDTLHNRLREMACLNAGLNVTLDDERDGRSASFRFDGGIREFVRLLNGGKVALHDEVVYLNDTRDQVEVEVALQWNDSSYEHVLAYTNNVHNREGGTHITGLRTALTRCINTYGDAHNLFREMKGGISGEDTREGLTAEVVTPWGKVALRSQLIGGHNLENLLFAIASLGASEYHPGDIAAALANVKGAPGRLERVPSEDDIALVVDYAHTPDALDNAINALRPLTPGRLFVVFGCGGDRDRTKRPLMGRAATRADIAILTSDNPRTEEPAAILADVEPGITEVGLARLNPEALATASRGFYALVDRREAIGLAVAAARPGDTVLIAGKGHENYQILGTTKIHFDDREEAAQADARRPRGQR